MADPQGKDRHTKRIITLTVAVFCCATLALTACSGAGTEAPGKNAGADAAAPTGGGTTTASAGIWCDFLSDMLPRIKNPDFLKDANANMPAGVTVSMQEVFFLSLIAWIENNKNRADLEPKVTNGVQLDAVTKTTCPSLRTEVLAVIGSPSFEAADT